MYKSVHACIRWTHIIWYVFFFFNDTATTEIYTLSLHDALPISVSVNQRLSEMAALRALGFSRRRIAATLLWESARSEEHTSELQSRSDLVCRLLLEKKILTSFTWERASIQFLPTAPTQMESTSP